MNDFEYDAYLKKKTAQGEKHRKKRKRGCSLPTDYMTNRQIEKLHGEVVSVNLNKPISWEEFKKLSKDTQALYYNALMKKFAVGTSKMAVELFGKSRNTLSAHFARLGIRIDKYTAKPKKDQKIAWEKFLKGEAEEFVAEPVDASVEEPVVEPVEAPVEERTENAPVTHEERTKNARTEIARVQFEFKNVEDFSTLARDLKVFIPAGANVTIIAEV